MHLCRALFIVFALATALSAQTGTTWTVGAQTSGPNAATFTAIQSAINVAANGDEIVVYPGTYFENIDLLGKTLVVRSLSGAAATIIDGGQLGSVVSCVTGEPPTTIIEGFTIRNGRAAFGAGMIFSASQPRIYRCRIVSNFALTAGGGSYCTWALPRFENCEFASNSAISYGGGAASDLGSVPEYFECTFTGNAASYGAGIGNNLGDPVFDRCTITSNSASQGGGGVDSFGGQVRMFDSLIQQNSAPIGAGWRDFNATSIAAQVRFVDNTATSFGGGLAAYSGSMSIENALFEGNAAPYGGGVFDFASNLHVRTSTITANNATSIGGGWAYVSGGAASVTNSIIWANTPTNVSASSSSSQFYSASFRYSDIGGGYPGVGNLNVDPLFVNPVGLDFHLAYNSPCRDAGAFWVASLAPVDIDGDCRFLDGALDMGCDEFYLKLEGTPDDLVLEVSVAGRYGAASPKYAPPSVLTTISMASATGVFASDVPILAAQFYTFQQPPFGLASYPAVHLDPLETAIIWTGIGVAAGGADIPFGTGPIYLQAQIPVGLTGIGLRVQLFAASPMSANGLFAASNAQDLIFL